MAYYDYERRYQQPARHDSYRNSSSPNLNGYSSSYNSYYEPRYAPRAAPPLPKRSSANSSRRSGPRSAPAWPPSPCVEDEKVSLSREVSSEGSEEGEVGEAIPRGSVDQYPIIQEIEQPNTVPDLSDERRFVLVSDPSADDGSRSPSDAPRERRRKSFAERGNMPHLNTDVDDTPLFTQRTSTPYAYTKPQKESLAPSAGDYFLSPESLSPPKSAPKRDPWDAQRDQNSRPPKSVPLHTRYDSLGQSPQNPRNDVFDDSNSDSDDNTHLRTTDRKPARYSFVKSDLQKEDLRTSLLDSQAKSEKKRSDPTTSGGRGPYESGSSSTSSKHPSPTSQSPRSSSPSLENGYTSRPKSRPVPVDAAKTSRSYSDVRPTYPPSPLRPNSPLPRDSPPRSPKLPPRRPADSPPSSRPSSRSGMPRPPSPLSSTAAPPLPPRVPVTGADWHATYPPSNTTDRSRPLSRFSRYETMPVPKPRIDVQSPSPARPPKLDSPLPYPVDDRPADVFMPPEEAYKFDHSSYGPPSPKPGSLRSPYPDSPKSAQSPIATSPRDRPSSALPRPSMTTRHTDAPEESPRMTRTRSNSIRSQSSVDGHRTPRRTLSLDRPMPSCPRSEPSAKYQDWYTLENCPNFDICPSCYNGVFADTQFAGYFKQVRRYDERFCDFSSPWMRLAWLLTIKQQRKSPDLIYQLATIADVERPCPKDQQVSGTGWYWYGIPDQRDGVHVANFAVCQCDRKMLEALCPAIRGYLTRLPTSQYGSARQGYTCSLRTTSKRFPTYLDALVELDEEATRTGRAPDISSFIALARDHAFKSECAKDKPCNRRPWHYIASLPEFTVCEECFDELIWPAMRRKNRVACLFTGTTQLIPNEDNTGTSCCLYSPRMRRYWANALEDQDYDYLKKRAVSRKKAESRLNKEKLDLQRWLDNMSMQGGYRESDYERLRRDIRAVDDEWKAYE